MGMEITGKLHVSRSISCTAPDNLFDCATFDPRKILSKLIAENQFSALRRRLSCDEEQRQNNNRKGG